MTAFLFMAGLRVQDCEFRVQDLLYALGFRVLVSSCRYIVLSKIRSLLWCFLCG